MIIFSNGLRAEFFGNFGRQGFLNMKSSTASNGTGRVLMVPSPKLLWVGKKTGKNPTDRAKSGTKRSLLTDGDGIPLAIVTAPANRHDAKLFTQTLDNIILQKPDAETASHLCADKAYDSAELRRAAEERNYKPHILSRGDEKKDKKRDPKKKSRRWVVERTHSWLNKFRRVFIRWEKKSINYEAILHFVSAIITFRAGGLFG